MTGPSREFVLARKGDEVVIRFADGNDEIPVRLVWARPLYARGREVSLLDAKKHEVMMISNLDSLDAASREIAEDELAKRYLMARVTRVIRTEAHFGSRYWHVQTELGVRRFAMKDPVKNATWITDDHLIVRDTLGNRYELKPFSELDAFSKAEVMKVI